jgi:hypothetical protein
MPWEETPLGPAGNYVPAAGDYSIGSDVWPGLAKLAEECGEGVQIAMKIIAAGGANVHWDSSVPLAERLEEEIADITAAIVFTTENNPRLDTERISARANRKLKLFRSWHAAHQDHSNGKAR